MIIIKRLIFKKNSIRYLKIFYRGTANRAFSQKCTLLNFHKNSEHLISGLALKNDKTPSRETSFGGCIQASDHLKSRGASCKCTQNNCEPKRLMIFNTMLINRRFHRPQPIKIMLPQWLWRPVISMPGSNRLSCGVACWHWAACVPSHHLYWMRQKTAQLFLQGLIPYNCD